MGSTYEKHKSLQSQYVAENSGNSCVVQLDLIETLSYSYMILATSARN
jgi:hypothetical protein